MLKHYQVVTYYNKYYRSPSTIAMPHTVLSKAPEIYIYTRYNYYYYIGKNDIGEWVSSSVALMFNVESRYTSEIRNIKIKGFFL